ncbi:MAG: TOBE domain-containing protein, partial [Chromatiales bacterium]|nr:TOBE domain-containing protein [Chromatiales bacterium]
VVMNDGKVEQSASPRDVYNAPDSGFVARFIGGHNIVIGRLSPDDASADSFVLDTPHGRVAGPITRQFAARTGSASAAIRSDMIGISASLPDQQPSDNCLHGTVQTIEYHGSSVRLVLDVGLEEEFIVFLSEGAFYDAPAEIGANVAAMWQPQAVHLLEHYEGVPHTKSQ